MHESFCSWKPIQKEYRIPGTPTISSHGPDSRSSGVVASMCAWALGNTFCNSSPGDSNWTMGKPPSAVLSILKLLQTSPYIKSPVSEIHREFSVLQAGYWLMQIAKLTALFAVLGPAIAINIWRPAWGMGPWYRFPHWCVEACAVYSHTHTSFGSS